jgi:predicted nucleotidyltransferase component of viral defense system
VLINSEIIETIAADLGVDESLIEKDWYAVRIIGSLAQIRHPLAQLVFSGGTSLSKGYGLLKRFSEDIDFKVAMSKKMTEGERRMYRNLILDTVREGGDEYYLDEDKIDIGGGYIKCEIAYNPFFQQAQALRPNVKLEISYNNPRLPFEERGLSSFVDLALGNEVSIFMPCVTPVETAADKLSALLWRVASRDRNSPKDDPTMIRHLHDLAILENVINSSSDFKTLALDCFAADAKRDKTSGTAEMPVPDRLQNILNQLESDPLYKEEYNVFVLGMSYADQSEQYDFQAALAGVSRLARLFASPPT